MMLKISFGGFLIVACATITAHTQELGSEDLASSLTPPLATAEDFWSRFGAVTSSRLTKRAVKFDDDNNSNVVNKPSSGGPLDKQSPGDGNNTRFFPGFVGLGVVGGDPYYGGIGGGVPPPQPYYPPVGVAGVGYPYYPAGGVGGGYYPGGGVGYNRPVSHSYYPGAGYPVGGGGGGGYYPGGGYPGYAPGYYPGGGSFGGGGGGGSSASSSSTAGSGQGFNQHQQYPIGGGGGYYPHTGGYPPYGGVGGGYYPFRSENKDSTVGASLTIKDDGEISRQRGQKTNSNGGGGGGKVVFGSS